MPQQAEPAEIASHLRITSAQLTRRMRQHVSARIEDATPAQYMVLSALDSAGTMTLSQLAASQGAQLTTVGRTVNRLVSLGFVDRLRSTQDGRVVLVRPTRAGRTLVKRVQTQNEAFLASRVAELDPESQDLVARALFVIDHLVSDAT